MLLDFRKIFNGELKTVSKNLSLDLSGEDFGAFTAHKPVLVNIEAAFEVSAVKLVVNVKTTLITLCARCLDDLELSCEFECIFFVKDGEWAEDNANGNNLPFSNDGKLDINEFIYEELVLQVPTIQICSEDCMGICTNCGQKKPCKCKQEQEIDERLLPLKQLLTD